MVKRLAYRREEKVRMYKKDENRSMYLIPRGGGKGGKLVPLSSSFFQITLNLLVTVCAHWREEKVRTYKKDENRSMYLIPRGGGGKWGQGGGHMGPPSL